MYIEDKCIKHQSNRIQCVRLIFQQCKGWRIKKDNLVARVAPMRVTHNASKGQLAQAPSCEHGRDSSPWRAPGTVGMIKSCFTDTLPGTCQVPAGARSAIRGDLSSFSENATEARPVLVGSLTGFNRGPCSVKDIGRAPAGYI